MAQQDIDSKILHHTMMAAYHSKEATQLLKKKKEGVSTPSSQKGLKKYAGLDQATIDKFRARARS